MTIDHERALRTAALVKSRLSKPAHLDRMLPADELLLELAESLLQLARRALQQIYVTGTAAHQYQRATGIEGIEDARRELTELLLEARPKDGDPSRWRLRSRDLDARVSLELEGRLAVVTHVHLRDREAQRYPRPSTPPRPPRRR